MAVLSEFISVQIEKTFWMQRSSRRIHIDATRLIEQFSAKDPGTFGVPEPSNSQQIMLNQKIAHNFSELMYMSECSDISPESQICGWK